MFLIMWRLQVHINEESMHNLIIYQLQLAASNLSNLSYLPELKSLTVCWRCQVRLQRWREELTTRATGWVNEWLTRRKNSTVAFFSRSLLVHKVECTRGGKGSQVPRGLVTWMILCELMCFYCCCRAPLLCSCLSTRGSESGHLSNFSIHINVKIKKNVSTTWTKPSPPIYWLRKLYSKHRKKSWSSS
jgi:hypothetical protein